MTTERGVTPDNKNNKTICQPLERWQIVLRLYPEGRQKNVYDRDCDGDTRPARRGTEQRCSHRGRVRGRSSLAELVYHNAGGIVGSHLVAQPALHLGIALEHGGAVGSAREDALQM